MKAIRTAAGLAALTTCLMACEDGQQGLQRASEIPESGLAKKSYALGQSLGSSVKASQLEIDRSFFNAGFYDALEGEQRMTAEDIQATLMAAQQEAQQSQMEARAETLGTNMQLASAFLEQNATADGVVTTDSGLQYKVLAEGDGESPAAEDTV
ncbi:MAG: hypothetical protein HKO07_00615, partial [Pseudomonadales bacterium]|nr:hypothetical protein [Pseudomonadales bacterium]